MAKDKQQTFNYIIVALLVINTLFLGGIFFKLCCSSGGSGFCPLSKKGAGAICPYSKKGPSGSMQAGSMKGSM